MSNSNKQFIVVNAFAEGPFGGNPAAVFTEADGLETETMQLLARQLNLVETVFVLPAGDDADFRLRYFTPEEELPVAGHPTIAAWLALLHKGQIDVEARTEYRQVNVAGTQEIQFTKTESGNWMVTMKQPPPKFLAQDFDREEVASIFGISVGDLDSNLPIEAVDTGLGHLIVPIRSLEALRRVKRQIDPLRRLCDSAKVREAQLFCFEVINKPADLHTRNICPREGLEDPACGTGNAALSAYLSRFCWPDKPELNLKIEQGYTVEMPSLIQTRTIHKNGTIDVFVGGNGIVMLEGKFLIN